METDLVCAADKVVRTDERAVIDDDGLSFKTNRSDEAVGNIGVVLVSDLRVYLTL